MPTHIQLSPSRRQTWGVMDLALAACCLIMAVNIANRTVRAEQAVEVGRLNGIIEHAERGEHNFNRESWQLLPDQQHDLFGLLKLQSALAELRPDGSKHPIQTPVVRMSMEASSFEKHCIKQYLDAGLLGGLVREKLTHQI